MATGYNLIDRISGMTEKVELYLRRDTTKKSPNPEHLWKLYSKILNLYGYTIKLGNKSPEAMLLCKRQVTVMSEIERLAANTDAPIISMERLATEAIGHANILDSNKGNVMVQLLH